MSVITITADEALRPEFIEQTVITKMTPKLPFLDLFPVQDLGGSSTFAYFSDATSAEDDITAGVMSTPMLMSELGNLPKINVSEISKKVGDTYEFGYKLEFSRNVTREKGFVDEILRAYDRAAYGMQRKINGDVLSAMSSYAAAPTISIDTTWDTSADICDNIDDMQTAFDQDGWDFELTDLYLHKTNYNELKKYYRNVEGIKFDPNDVEGSRANNVKSSITEGTLYGLDNNIKPITIYKNTDSEYSSNPQGSIINIDKYQQKEYPKKIVIELWAEMGIGVKYGNAILKQTGI